MAIERKTFKFEVTAVDEENGIIEGYGSTFIKEPDSYGDIVDEGTFTKTIKENADTIVSLFNHSVMEPIGKPALSVDKKGLFAKIKLVRGVQKAEETLLLAKAGVLTRMSIGYNTIKETWEDGIRHLKEVRLFDVSPVVFAANEDAVITGVKSLDDSIQDLLKSGRVLSATNIGKIQSALNALQSLLDAAVEEAEPDKSTLLAEAVKEAEELESVVNTLKAKNEGFDTKEAEQRIEAILDQLKSK